jgi:hypothetical protein
MKYKLYVHRISASLAAMTIEAKQKFQQTGSKKSKHQKLQSKGKKM